MCEIGPGEASPLISSDVVDMLGELSASGTNERPLATLPFPSLEITLPTYIATVQALTILAAHVAADGQDAPLTPALLERRALIVQSAFDALP